MTIVEVLVVVGIIGILLAIIFPAIQAVRETSRRVSCRNNLRQLGMAIADFEATNERFPPGQLAPKLNQPPDFDSHPLLGHIGYVLPFIEQVNYYHALGDLDWSIDAMYPAWFLSPSTWSASSQAIPLLRCPSDACEAPVELYLSAIPFGGSTTFRFLSVGGVAYDGWTNYLGCSGDVLIGGNSLPERGIIYSRSETKARDISDGLSHTILAGELIGGTASIDGVALGMAHARHSILSNGIGCRWGYFDDVSGDDQDTTIFTFSSRHPGRSAHFVRADGSVLGIPANIAPDTLASMMTRDGHEVLGNEF